MARTQTPNHQMAPAGAGFEARCASAVANYREQLGSFVQEYRDGINAVSGTHETNMGQWLADPNRTEAGFEELIAMPGETLDHLATYTDFNTRWGTDTARRQLGSVLPPQDQQLLFAVQRSARGFGVQDPRTQSLLSGASSREAREVMEASLDRTVLRQFQHKVDLYGAQDRRAQALLNGLSCPEARAAIEASEECITILKPFREKAKAWEARNGSLEEVTEALRKAPDQHYLNAMIASLDQPVWEHAQRANRARGVNDRRTQDMLNNASNPNSRAAMEMLLSGRPPLRFQGSSRIFNMIYTRAGGTYRAAGAPPNTGPASPGGGANQPPPPRQGPRTRQHRGPNQGQPGQRSHQRRGPNQGQTGRRTPPNHGTGPGGSGTGRQAPPNNRTNSGGNRANQPPPRQGPPRQEQPRPSRPRPAESLDLYVLLGVPRDADEQTIKKEFRKLARDHHPDTGGDDTVFKSLINAFELLSDPDKRRFYDSLTDPAERSWYAKYGKMAGYSPPSR